MIRRQVADFVEHASSKYNLANTEDASSEALYGAAKTKAAPLGDLADRERGLHALKQPRV
ncbi:hypothetical protein D3C86_2147030 [compost metagenome]